MKSRNTLPDLSPNRRYYHRHWGLPIGLAVIFCWCLALALNLQQTLSWTRWSVYLGVLVQTHLFTGLFITAHDAMHGTVHPHSRINHGIGWLAAMLFVFNPYHKLRRKHYEHHLHPVTDDDPDYHPGGFWRWYLGFLMEYITWWQVLAAAAVFELAALWIPKPALVVFWVIPSILGTLQLFYFGTYLPHKPQHDPNNRHRSRSRTCNHILSFLSCYHFGYHYEHHAQPQLPWWALPWQKEAMRDGRPGPRAYPKTNGSAKAYAR